MKNRLIKILAVYLSIAIMLPTLCVLEILAQDLTDSYKTHLMNIAVYKPKSGSAFTHSNNIQNPDSDLSGVNASTFTYGWADAPTLNNTADYFYASVATEAVDGAEIGGITYKTDQYVDASGNIIGKIEKGKLFDTEGKESGTFSNGVLNNGKEYYAYSDVYKINPTDALMFYVKMPSQAPQTEIFLRTVTASLAIHEESGEKKTIYPAVNANQWIEPKIDAPIYFLEKGYEKWTTSKTVKSTYTSSKGNLVIPAGFEGWVRIPVSSLSQDEAKSSFVFRLDFYQKQLGGKYTEGGAKLGSFMFVEDGEKGYVKASVDGQGDVSLVNEREHSKVSMMNIAALSNGEKVDNETHISNGYTYKLSADSSEITFSNSKALGDKGGIMLYYKQPLDKDGKLNITAGSSSLVKNSDIYTLNRGKNEWKKAAVNDNGAISLSKGFEGYIFVPTQALDNAEGKNIDKIRLSNITSGSSVGTFLFVGEFVSSSIEIKQDGSDAYINLFESAYYNATLIETEDTVTSTQSNNNFYNVSNKVNDPTYVDGIDNGYYYEVTTGSAAEGTTIQELSQLLSYTAHTLTQFNTNVSNRTGIPNPDTEKNYTNKWIKSVLAEKNNTSFSSGKVNITFDEAETDKLEEQHITDGEFVRATIDDDKFYTPITLIDGYKLPVMESSAVIFYIESTGALDSEAHLHLQVDGTYHKLQPNAEYSLLRDGTAQWTKYTTKDSGTSKKGNVVIPANFSGWLKIAVTSFQIDSTDIKNGNLDNIRYFPVKIGGRYGAVSISHFMTVDEGGSDCLTFMDGNEEKSFIITVNESSYTAVPSTQMTTAEPKSNDGKPPFTVKKQDILTPIGNVPGVHIGLNSTNYPNGFYTNKPYVNDESTVTETTRKFARFSTGPDLKIGPSDSVLVYVDHSDSEKAVFTLFGVGNNGWFVTRAGKPCYLLPENSPYWIEKQGVALNTESGEDFYGFIEIPASFKGWVRIPMSSVAKGRSTAIPASKEAQNYFVIMPNGVGGDYGTLKVGGFRILEESDNLIYITDNGATAKVPLMNGLDLTIKKPTYEVIVGNFLGDKSLTSKAPSGQIYSTIALKSNKVIDTGDAIMFYATQNGTSQSSFAVGLNDFEWSLIAGAEYAIYNSKTQYWNNGIASENGKINLPARFSGWVRIPYSSFTDKDKDPANAEITISKINFTPYTLGGAWGDLQLGTFMVTDNGNENIVTMRVDKGEEKPITESKVKAYAGTTLALKSIYPAGVNARKVSIKEIDTGLLSGTSTFKVSAINEAVTADLTSATDIDLSQKASIGEGEALFFYVELEGDKENTLILGDSLLVKNGASYYTLGVGNDAQWKENTVLTDGMMPLPAGFKGYVRIPANSFANLPDAFEKFVFGFEKVGGEYKAPAFGTFIVIDNGNYNYLDICLNDAIGYTSLIICDSLEGYVLQGKAERKDDNAKLLSVSELGNTLTTGISTGYAYKAMPTGEPVSLEGKAYTPRLTFILDEIYKSEMENAGGLMFYVSLPEGKSNRVFVQAQADNSATLLEGSAFWILPEGDGYWTKRVVNTYNELPLPEGFKGWVRIDAKALWTKTNPAVQLKGVLSQINLSWRYIGGDWGEPEFGTFIMLDRSAESGKLKLRGQDEMNIYGSKIPTVYDRDDIAVWETITAPFDGYADGDIYGAGTTDKTNKSSLPSQIKTEEDAELYKKSEQAEKSEYDYRVISNIPQSADTTEGKGADKTGVYTNPFGSRGIEFTSTEAVDLHLKEQLPHHTFSHPFTLKDSKGIVLYVNIPKIPGDNLTENPDEEKINHLWLQLRSASGKTVTLKYKKVVATLADGTKSWKNVGLDVSNNVSQLIKLPSGFEGYVYIPLEALETTNLRSLNEYDDIYRMVVGFGHYGGSDANGNLKEEGKAYIGGMWLSKNGVLSHDGAYVDGDTVCRNIFTGEQVSEDEVCYDPFEKPGGEGWIYETLPEATHEDAIVMTEKISGHSASIVWDKFEGADSYRIDLYQITAATSAGFDEVYFTYLTSYFTNDTSIEIDGLSPNSYYTVYIIPLSNGKGLAIYPPFSVYTESEIIGDMLGYRYDPFEYGWQENDDFEDDIALEDTLLTDSDEEEETTYLRKVIRRKKKSSGMSTWIIIVIIVSAVLLVGAATATTIILVKRKKRKAAGIIEEQAEEDNIS